jgi:hypothetical protein
VRQKRRINYRERMFIAGTREVISPEVFEYQTPNMQQTRHVIAITDMEIIKKKTLYQALIQTRHANKVIKEELEWLEASNTLLMHKPAMINTFKKAIKINQVELDSTQGLSEELLTRIKKLSNGYFNDDNLQPIGIIHAAFAVVINHIPDYDKNKSHSEALDKVLGADTGYSALLHSETDKDIDLTSIYTQLGIVHNMVIAHRRLVSGQLGVLSLLFQATVLDSGKKLARDAKALARAFLRPQLSASEPKPVEKEAIDVALMRAAKERKRKKKDGVEKTSNAARKLWCIEQRNTMFFIAFNSAAFFDDSLNITTLYQQGMKITECEAFLRTVIKLGATEKFTEINNGLSDKMFASGVRHIHQHLLAKGFTELPISEYLLWAENKRAEIYKSFTKGKALNECINTVETDGEESDKEEEGKTERVIQRPLTVKYK